MSQKKKAVPLSAWEYWPTSIVYIPVFAYYLWLSLRSANLLFFTRVNPGMRMAGLFGCSKYKHLKQLPEEYIPKTLYVDLSVPVDLEQRLEELGISYPLIAKPDAAERGRGIWFIKDLQTLQAYHEQSGCDYIIQEYIDSPFEAGLFVWRKPETGQLEIPSLVVKEFLSVRGDGKSSLQELIFAKARAARVWPHLQKVWKEKLGDILQAGEELYLEPIGNHSRGTSFLNGQNLISEELLAWIEPLVAQLGEFHYGRFDLRAGSREDFLLGKDIKILEINGVNAEPAHIYDPNARLLDAWKTLFKHWYMLFAISRANAKRAIPKRNWSHVFESYKIWKQAKKQSS